MRKHENMTAEIVVEWACDAPSIQQLAQEWRSERARFSGATALQDIERIALERQCRNRAFDFLVARQSGRLVGYGALEALDEPLPIAFGLKTLFRAQAPRLRLLGGDMPVANDANPQAVLKALFTRLAVEKNRLITIEECAETSAIHRHADMAAPFKLQALDPEPQKIHTIDLPGSLNAYFQTRKGKQRNMLKRRVKAFDRHFDQNTRLVCIDTSDAATDFIKAVGAVFANSWKRGVLSDAPPLTNADLPYLERLAQNGALRSYVLYGGDAPIACCYVTQMNGRCDFLDVLYHQSYGQLAPGVVLIMKVIADLYTRNTPCEFNFGYGENAYKRLFSKRAYAANYYYAVRPGTKAAAAVAAQLGLRRAYHAARKTVVALKIDHRVRRLAKRGRAPARAIATAAE